MTLLALSPVLRDLHDHGSWVVVVGNGLVGAWALVAHRVEAARHPALWWATATLTTVGAASEPVTIGGRIVALVLMFGGLVLLGYVAGVVAAVLFGPPREPRRAVPAPDR